MKHTISVLLQNKPGVLSRVTGLFSGRGFNIESLCVAATLDPEISCLTVISKGDDAIIEQITKQLHKLIDVIKVKNLSEIDHIEREMMFIKVAASNMDACATIQRMTTIFRARIVDVKNKTFTIEITGNRGKLNAFIDAISDHTILELVRSGSMGISRGSKILHV